ncbi:MAG: DNA translocase FtsK [Lachnospiraceae bacterium]|nr:DNA translocase FtsK [Lachnospiraceae bacterium]
MVLCVVLGFGKEITIYFRRKNEYNQRMEELRQEYVEEEPVVTGTVKPAPKPLPDNYSFREPRPENAIYDEAKVNEAATRMPSAHQNTVETLASDKTSDNMNAGTRRRRSKTSTENSNSLNDENASNSKGPNFNFISFINNKRNNGNQENAENVVDEGNTQPSKRNFFSNLPNYIENKKEENETDAPVNKPKQDDNGEPVYKRELRDKFDKNKTKNASDADSKGTDIKNGSASNSDKPVASFSGNKAGLEEIKTNEEEIEAAINDSDNEALKAAKKEAKAPKKRSERKSAKKMDKNELDEAVSKFGESFEDAEEVDDYIYPTYDLLDPVPVLNDKINSDAELMEMADKLQETLKSFGVNVTIEDVVSGPSVTRFELKPEVGVKVNKVKSLSDDIMLSLAVKSIRIEAPIPGKSAIGIEIPNAKKRPVTFRELIEGEEFKDSNAGLAFAVGKDIYGKIIVTDIEKMPHLLVAGATGSGKSVCINTLIMSLLYKYKPNELKLIMIDPKVVELSVYNGIPHLFCPVVTDAKEAAAALNWAVAEMMKRYNKFKELGVRNIKGYNKKVASVPNAEDAGYGHMCSLVLIVDEFADLMAVASKEVEQAVCRIAQLARAAGIHLILATQRPSVDVITGLIKANIPSRIALSTSSAIDSRTIIDMAGAEKLVGHGDMLFFPAGSSEPARLQGSFLTDEEIERVTNFLKDNNDAPVYDRSVTKVVQVTETNDASKEQDDRDEYFEQAARFVIESERASAGQLQRKFKIGFNRAGRILDQLCEAGIVGESEGTKPRAVLVTIPELNMMLGVGAEDDSSEENEDSTEDEINDSVALDALASLEESNDNPSGELTDINTSDDDTND